MALQPFLSKNISTKLRKAKSKLKKVSKFLTLESNIFAEKQDIREEDDAAESAESYDDDFEDESSSSTKSISEDLEVFTDIAAPSHIVYEDEDAEKSPINALFHVLEQVLISDKVQEVITVLEEILFRTNNEEELV